MAKHIIYILREKKEYVLSFIIPALILIGIFALYGIYPGSEITILKSDLAGQYISFFSYLYHIGEGYNSIMFQHLSGLGGGFWGTFAYYLSSPLSALIFFFDPENLPDAIYLLIIIKISLSGLSFSLYLRNSYIKCTNKMVNILFSSCYALMSYNIVYCFNVMWLDGVVMLPVVILGMDYLLSKRDSLFFIIPFTMSIVFNYYTSYMIAIFCILYYVYYLISNEIALIKGLKQGFYLLLCGIFSVLLSAWLWIPAALDLLNGRLAEGSKSITTVIRTPIEILRQLIPFSFTGILAADNPALYCGCIVTVLCVAFFLLHGFPAKSKLAVFFMITVFFCSFCFGNLDSAWHGFQIPNCFPSRYSFIFVFFLISIATRTLLYLLEQYSKKINNIFKVICIIMVYTDLIINSVYQISTNEIEAGTYMKRIYYEYVYNQNQYLLKEKNTEGSIVSDVDYSHNDGLLSGIPSLDYFSSSYNSGISNLFMHIGMDSYYNHIEDKGMTPLHGLLLGVELYADRFEPKEDSMFKEYYNFKERILGADIYENEDASIYGYLITNNVVINDFSYDPFDNLNKMNAAITNVDNVFIKLNSRLKETEVDSNSGIISKYYEVYPLEGEHLMLYVSPYDYFNDINNKSYDAVYFNETQIMLYENIGRRYIVDLGVSDGTPLDFRFDSKIDESEIYFYSYDDTHFKESVEAIRECKAYNVSYSKDGMEGVIKADKDSEMVLLIPYDQGYNIYLDDIKIDYYPFLDALIKIQVPKGEHVIRVKYFTPGLAAGIIISLLTLIVGISIKELYWLKYKMKNQK